MTYRITIPGLAALHHAAEAALAAGPHATSPVAPLAFQIILAGLRGAAEGGQGTGAFAPMPRFRITWEGHQLAILAAESPALAIAALLAERGYGYYTAEVLTAELLPPVQRHDVAGNPIHEARP